MIVQRHNIVTKPCFTFLLFYPKLINVTYNYSETGHGKGALDGIGGVCKRTADRVVGQGKYISSIDQLIEKL